VSPEDRSTALEAVARDGRIAPVTSPFVRVEPPPGSARFRVAGPGAAGRLREKLVVGRNISQGVLEQYRKLAASLHYAQSQHGTRVLMMTSTLASEGKTLTATNLALTLSESYRRRVLLMTPTCGGRRCTTCSTCRTSRASTTCCTRAMRRCAARCSK